MRFLPAEDTRVLDVRLAEVTAWRMATPAVYLTYSAVGDAAQLPVLMLSLLQQQLFASVAYSTALEQLEGSRPTASIEGCSDHSWSPVKMVNDVVIVLLLMWLTFPEGTANSCAQRDYCLPPASLLVR